MLNSKLVNSPYGKVRVIERGFGLARWYVKRTNVQSWVVSTDARLSFDSMVEINGEYHFGTLKALHTALLEVE